ncbi:hypothetical protein RHMOL_Rhmol09G0003000 [Rhododendron molle]|uniref:Uncharacterized protein n=1 Tax=Rhododendron molle TaxID=49168 RepID=A0ACC0MA03_RHOML|nr:hypothetical protein RHMOL_Rhmol09G0003000 [Rhododendron molle]
MGWLTNLDLFHIEKDEKTLYLNPYAWNQGLFEFMRSAGMISDESYKQLNLLCDSLSFIHPSGQFDKALDMASEEHGEIDPYSILTPLCPATSSLSSQQKKRWRDEKNKKIQELTAGIQGMKRLCTNSVDPE